MLTCMNSLSPHAASVRDALLSAPSYGQAQAKWPPKSPWPDLNPGSPVPGFNCWAVPSLSSEWKAVWRGGPTDPGL